MQGLRFLTRLLIATIAGWAIVASTAHADLVVRVSVYDSDGNLYAGNLGQQSHTVVRPDPVPAGLSQITHSFIGLQNLAVAFTGNFAQTETGSTNHGMLINLNYQGGVGSASDTVIIEFIGQNYQFPISPPDVKITSNASPSSGGMQVDSLTMVSGVSATDAGLPGTPGDTSGLLGLTSGDGFISVASSVLIPNPAVGNQFSLAGPTFSFYQAFTFSDFIVRGQGNLSADSTLSAVPEPTTLVAALTALPVLAGFYARRRRVNRSK